MKQSMHILLISIMAALCSMAFAQSGYISTFSLIDYELDLGFMEAFTPKTIYLCSDSSLMILGNADFFDDVLWTPMPIIIKLDSQGNLIWYEPIWSTYGSCSNIIGIEIDQNDVVHFVVGRPNSYHVGSIDTNGSHSLHGHKSFVSDGSSRFNHALRLTNGEIMICGKVAAQSYGNYGALFRMSAIGDSLAATYYPPDVQGYEANNCVKLVQRDEHSVYVASYFNSDGLSILQTDMDGSILNRYDIGDSYQYHGTNMFLESDSLAVFTIDFNNGDYSTSLTSIDISGNMQTYSLGSNMSHILAASKASDGFVLLGMNIQGGFRISKFDQFLSNIWSVSYSGITTYESFPFSKEKIQIDQYGCIYFAGNEIGGSEYFNSAVAYKLLPNGQVPVADEVQTPPVNAISAYPNPMKDHLNIKITQDDKPVIAANHIDIFNIKGQLIRSLKLTKGETVWDGKDKQGRICPDGIYLLRSSNRSTHTTKICKTH